MRKELGRVSRRDFVKVGAAAAVAVGLPAGLRADEPQDKKKEKAKKKVGLMPTRVLGRTGVPVSILNFGASGGTRRRMLNAVWESGIRYFDTADCYEKGKHEQGLARWYNKEGVRKDLFLVTKDHPKTPEQWIEMVDKRLESLQTDYIDLFMIHAIGEREIGYGTNEHQIEICKSKEWARAVDKTKKAGKIRFAGHSLHGDIPLRSALLRASAEGGWVDAIMLMYDTQAVREHKEFNDALDKAHKAGIGLVTMKEMRAVEHVAELVPGFKEMGLTPHQAVLHAVWTDERIASICSAITNLKMLKENVEAARKFKPLDKKQLAMVLNIYQQSGRRFCTGCDGRCQRAAGTKASLNDITRYLSYYECDGAREKARELFARLSPEQKDWHGADLEAASAACVSKLDFTTLLPRAQERLA